MKNLFLIPTNKPSRFYSIDGKHKLVNSTMAMDWYISSVGYKPHDIYITNDEEIKEGDWIISDQSLLSPLYDAIGKVEIISLETKKIIQSDNSWYWTDLDCKKIILTTDPQLIKDGVQEIDDEFLEWFVQNSSCEEVETHIVKLCTSCGQQYCDNRDCRGYDDEPKYLISYPKNIVKQVVTYCEGYEISREKIIISKEEPKPHSFCETPEDKCTMNYCDENGCMNRKRVLIEPIELKQEKTFEDVLDESLAKVKDSYTKEEVKVLIQKALAEFQNKPHSWIEYSNWIKQNI